jgi:hypothetical protein
LEAGLTIVDTVAGSNNKKRGSICFAIHYTRLGLLLFSTGALAQQTLVYAGQPLEGASFNLITGTVILAQPLPANGTSIVVPTSYTFIGDETGIPVNGLVTDGVPQSFSFTTANGIITAWNIVAQSASGSANVTISMTNLGDSYEFRTYAPDCQITPAKCTDTINSNTLPGTWSVPQAQVAPAMVVPAGEHSSALQ